MRLKRADPGLSDDQLTVAWQGASLLLGYPDARVLDLLPTLRRAADELPAQVGGPLAATVAHLAAGDPGELQAAYVETFDTSRRHSLFLTYFAHGDTRKRGMALLRFKQTYLRSGHVLDESELPDHLCVVLEYAATVDHRLGVRLLLDHRAGLELLRLSLQEAGSGWAGAVASVCATLPPLRGDEWDAVRRLAAAGPPEEEVGLTPYATPGFDPGPAVPTGPRRPSADPRSPSRPQDLPTPSFPGAR